LEWLRWLVYELDTEVFYVNLPRFVGEVNGRGFAPVVYEMPEMRFRRVILGLRRDPLEGEGQPKELQEIPEVWGQVLASDLQKRGK
jgi:hypothetical protein